MSLACSHYGIVLRDDPAYKTINAICSWLNLLLAIPTTLINSSLITVLLTSSDRTKPCQMLILNLAITDCLAGFANMPIQFVVLRFISQSRDPCDFANITTPFGYMLGIASFVTVSLVAVERYISIFYPFYHLSHLNSQKTGISILILWLISISVVIPSIVTSMDTFLYAFSTFLVVAGTALNIYTYVRILLRARKIRSQIHNEAIRLGGQHRTERDKSLLRVGGLILISMSICYAPIASYSLLKAFGITVDSMDYALSWAWTLAMANSLINPIITCVFSPPVRRKIWKLWKCKLEYRVTDESWTAPSVNRVTVKTAS